MKVERDCGERKETAGAESDRSESVGRGSVQCILVGTFVIKVTIMFHQHVMKNEILMKTLSKQTSHRVLCFPLALAG